MIKDTKENVESKCVFVLIKHCNMEAHEQWRQNEFIPNLGA
jgi:hypothetical protein